MYPYYVVFRQTDAAGQQGAGFKDFRRFLSDLEEAIQDEASAIRFYQKLMEQAPDEKQRASIRHAYEDEIKHLRLFRSLYRRLARREAPVSVRETPFESYKDGIRKAFESELEAYEMYRNMYLATAVPEVREILFEAMTDESEHAQRFNFIYSEL